MSGRGRRPEEGQRLVTRKLPSAPGLRGVQECPFAGFLLSMTLVFVAIVVVLWALSVVLALGLVRSAARDDLITERASAAERRRSFRLLARKRAAA
jgi:hypothetical protein